MTYAVQFKRHQAYIHATITGSNTRDVVLQYVNDIQNECKRRNCFRVLVEDNLDGPRFSEMELFSIINEISPEVLGFFEAIAYVNTQLPFEKSRFTETIAVNRGMPIAIFSSLPDAQTWLINQKGGADEQHIFRDGNNKDKN